MNSSFLDWRRHEKDITPHQHTHFSTVKTHTHTHEAKTREHTRDACVRAGTVPLGFDGLHPEQCRRPLAPNCPAPGRREFRNRAIRQFAHTMAAPPIIAAASPSPAAGDVWLEDVRPLFQFVTGPAAPLSLVEAWEQQLPRPECTRIPLNKSLGEPADWRRIESECNILWALQNPLLFRVRRV